MKGRAFQIDRENGKFMGVCAGIARYTGIDATFVRIGAVVLTVIGGFPWTLVAYFGAAWLGKPGSHAPNDAELIRDWRESRRAPDLSAIDRRIGAVETEVSSRESKLAREIEALR